MERGIHHPPLDICFPNMHTMVTLHVALSSPFPTESLHIYRCTWMTVNTIMIVKLNLDTSIFHFWYVLSHTILRVLQQNNFSSMSRLISSEIFARHLRMYWDETMSNAHACNHMSTIAIVFFVFFLVITVTIVTLMIMIVTPSLI